MNEPLLFNIVFLCQVLLISVAVPRLLVGRTRRLIDSYPPSEYPRLYRTRTQTDGRVGNVYLLINLLVAAAGVALLLAGVLSPDRETLIRDNDLVATGYLILQFAALLIAPTTVFPYFSLHRATDSRASRSAALRPRRLFDFVSPALIAAAGTVYLGFVALILYVRQFDFPWFGGYLNIVIASAMNLFFAVVVFRLLYGKKPDPFAADADRDRSIRRAARVLLLVSIAATLFTALTIGLQAFEMPGLKPVAFSAYAQLMALVSLREFRADGVDFEVYREESLANS